MENINNDFIHNEKSKTLQTSAIFPVLTDVVPDRRIVNLLRNVFAGKNSEFTAFSTYYFQYLMTADENLATALENISIQEMLHAEQLGKAILAFGGIPYYYNAAQNFWDARYVNYTIDRNSFLRQNILSEKSAIQDYEYIITQTNNQSLKDLINVIISQEKEHIEILESFLV